MEHFIDGERHLTHYLHLSEINESVLAHDKFVTTGETIGKSGNTGQVYGRYGGYHLHFEVKKWEDNLENWNRYCPYESIDELEDTEEYKKSEDGDSGGDDSMDGEEEEDGEENGVPGTNPGGDRPDDNKSFATSNSFSLASDPKSRFYRLAPKKGKTHILYLWNLEKLLEERGQYFESLSSGGTPDETYLNNLNTKINENYNLLSVNNLQYRKERSEQHGNDFSALPSPDGDPIRAYGWREDQSCQSNSIYVDGWHPVLSSTTKPALSSPIDGYFADYPSNSTVLLSRRINGMPAMLAYPYGEGRVVVTSMFEDWGFGHWQSSLQGRSIIRDLITWAKNPDSEIQEYNLRNNPDPELNLNLELKNISDA